MMDMTVSNLTKILSGERNEDAEWWKGLIAGVAGGVAGAIAMTVFERVVGDTKDGDTNEDFSPTVKATNAARKVFNQRPVTGESVKDIERTAVLPFGAVVGGGYGLLVEHFPPARINKGLGLSTLVYSAVNEEPKPPMSLVKTFTKNPLYPENREIVSLAIFGIVTEFVRRGVREMLTEEQSPEINKKAANLVD